MTPAAAVLGAVIAAAMLSLAGAAGGATSPGQQEGVFRVAVPVTVFAAIDPALWSLPSQSDVLRPACAALMAYPDKPFPAGRRLVPDLAEAEPVVSRNGRTYTFTIRTSARFSDGSAVTARAFVRALERALTPAMKSALTGFEDVVGAKAMLAGTATTLAGAVARGRTLTLRLTQRVRDLPARTAGLCAVPPNLAAEPEGAKAPLPSPAPYYVAEYVPGRQVVLERNRFYRGERPQRVSRIVADLGVDARTAVEGVASGEYDYVWGGAPDVAQFIPGLAQRYGVNRARFFVKPGLARGLFVLNTSRPLFRENVKLRQAVNFAVDRRTLMRELGAHVATATDQYFIPSMPAYRNERIYPLAGPDLPRARELARGRTRSGKAVFYTCTETVCVGLAQVVKRNLKAIGLEVEIKAFPRLVLFEKLNTPGEPYDIARIFWNSTSVPDPSYLRALFHGETAGRPGSINLSYFDSPKYNALLDRAALVPGPARDEAYGELDVRISRDAAPAIPYAITNAITFVSPRVGCVVLNPGLDLTAVCLK